MVAVAIAVVGLSTSSACGSFTLEKEVASWRAVVHYEEHAHCQRIVGV
jgi:hypothetical protein